MVIELTYKNACKMHQYGFIKVLKEAEQNKELYQKVPKRYSIAKKKCITIEVKRKYKFWKICRKRTSVCLNHYIEKHIKLVDKPLKITNIYKHIKKCRYYTPVKVQQISTIRQLNSDL